MAGRIIALGDIHGCDVALGRLLAELALEPHDRLVLLGDVVDRGPGTREAIDQLLELQARVPVVLVRGNHEEMMLEAITAGKFMEPWLRFGGSATLFSYGGDRENIPGAHLAFLEEALEYFQTDAELFIHANLEPGVVLEKQRAEWLRWTHLTGLETPHESGKRVLCGHTPQKSGVPLVIPGWVGLDTYAWGSGWLSALDVRSNVVYQARQRGDLRSFPLGGQPS